MKYLLLDVMGVIDDKNPTPSSAMDIWWFCNQLDPDKVRRVYEIVKTTDAKIVITSQWRTNRNALDGIQKAFAIHCGIRGREVRALFADYLPVGDVHQEIKRWLATEDYENYLIINDEPHSQNNEINTDFHVGITDEHVKQAIVILGRKEMIKEDVYRWIGRYKRYHPLSEDHDNHLYTQALEDLASAWDRDPEFQALILQEIGFDPTPFAYRPRPA